MSKELSVAFFGASCALLACAVWSELFGAFTPIQLVIGSSLNGLLAILLNKRKTPAV